MTGDFDDLFESLANRSAFDSWDPEVQEWFRGVVARSVELGRPPVFRRVQAGLAEKFGVAVSKTTVADTWRRLKEQAARD